jgi:hypothetical protein
MGFMEEMMGEMAGESPIVQDVEKVLEAMKRPKLEGLQPGDIIRQKKFGERYRHTFDDNPVVFVRYATEADRFSATPGRPLDVSDIVIAKVDASDGQLMHYAVESTHFEKV